MPLKIVQLEFGVRFGVFCDECQAEIVETGIATTHDPLGRDPLPRSDVVFLHKGQCDEQHETRVGGTHGWEELDSFIVKVGNGFGVDWKKTFRDVSLAASAGESNLGPDVEPGPRAPAGSIGTRARSSTRRRGYGGAPLHPEEGR